MILSTSSQVLTVAGNVRLIQSRRQVWVYDRSVALRFGCI
jgi:hypothetical protein